MPMSDGTRVYSRALSLFCFGENMDEMIIFGAQVKALGDGKVGGYLVRYGTPKDADLEGDFFSKETDLGVVDGASLPVYYHHGMDGVIKNRRLSHGLVKFDDVGAWMEAQLEMRDEYEKMIYQLAVDGKLGWSSGAAGHLVEREQIGKAWHIKSWPIAEASLTPEPAEPRNAAMPLKSLIPTGDTPMRDGGDAEPKSKAIHNKEIEMDEKELQAIAEKAATGAAEKTAEVLNDKHEAELKAAKAEFEAKAAQEADRKVDEFKKSLGLTEEVKAGYHIEIVQDEGDKPTEFKSVGDFFKAVQNVYSWGLAADKRLYGMFYKDDGTKATGLNEAIPSQGGFLVPEEMSSSFLERMYNTGEILSRVQVDPVAGNSMSVPGVDETSRVNGSRYGGVTSYWLEEGGTITASKPKFKNIPLKLKKVVALIYATDEVLEDANFLGSYINRVGPEELRVKVEDAFYNGTGVGMPQGFMNSDALVSATRENASNVTFNDIVGMWARRWAGVNDYVWMINQDVNPELDTLYLGDGATGIIPPRFIDYDSEGAMRMKGRPVLEVEYAKSLGTLGDISLVSWSQYAAIQKASGIQSAASIHVQFTTAEQAFRFIYRVDGQSLWYSALTPMNGSNTQSPFVALAATT